MRKLKCRKCNRESADWMPRSKFCFWCAGDMVRFDEHPQHAAETLAQQRERLEYLSSPARSDFANAVRGTYLDPDTLARRLKLCRAKIARLEIVVKLEQIRQAKSKPQTRNAKLK
jgi:hypothetical protein